MAAALRRTGRRGRAGRRQDEPPGSRRSIRAPILCTMFHVKRRSISPSDSRSGSPCRCSGHGWRRTSDSRAERAGLNREAARSADPADRRSRTRLVRPASSSNHGNLRTAPDALPVSVPRIGPAGRAADPVGTAGGQGRRVGRYPVRRHGRRPSGRDIGGGSFASPTVRSHAHGSFAPPVRSRRQQFGHVGRRSDGSAGSIALPATGSAIRLDPPPSQRVARPGVGGMRRLVACRFVRWLCPC